LIKPYLLKEKLKMTNKQTKQASCEIGMVGLGVMGRNLLLNMADHGFSVAGFDQDPSKVTALSQESKEHAVYAVDDVKEFIQALRQPRAIMLLIPAGPPVDSVIQELLPLLEPGDLIIDAGNSYFEDTNRRERDLTPQGIQFLGVGVSGGEEGARHGPSIMPGGTQKAYERVRPVLEAVAAKVNNEPCVTHLGPGSAGHYVKMIHNGIEYGIMQLIAETYDLMKRGLKLNDEQLHQIYTTWNKGELNGYLLEITGNIFGKKDDRTGHWLIDQILAVAQQNGTGMWTSRSAMELQVPTPTIDMAVSMRDMSVLVKERKQANLIYQQPVQHFKGNHDAFLTQLQHALYAGIIITYAQGMALLAVASEKYEYQLNLESVAKIWRGGCIIRAAFLENICTAFRTKKDFTNLLLAPNIAKLLRDPQKSLRKIVSEASLLGIPAPGLMASLSYFDSYSSEWLPANLIQAQRDYFGSHTYERIDSKGIFHTQWED
jgi:6-phosphogluconate dehydrogenase